MENFKEFELYNNNKKESINIEDKEDREEEENKEVKEAKKAKF